MVSENDADTQHCGEAAELLAPGVEAAAAILSDLIDAPVEIIISSAWLGGVWISGTEAFSAIHNPETIITQNFSGPIQGRAQFCLSRPAGIALTHILTGGHGAEPAELDAELNGILLEVGNIVLNGVMGSLTETLSAEFRYSLPELQTANRRREPLSSGLLGKDDALISDIIFRIGQQDVVGAAIAILPANGIRRLRNCTEESIGACC